MVATVTAEALGLPLEAVRVVMGDTEAAPYGLGGWGSRSTGVAAGAILRAASALRDKGVRIAAHLLEASPADLEVGGGRIAVRGAEQRAVTWAQVAQTAIVRTVDLPPGEEPGLEAFAVFDPPVDHVPRADGGMNACATYTNATHAAVVAVDPDTGEVTVLKYLVAHDCGTVINPVIVEGQVQGGVAQGLGGTLLEDLPYSAEGHPLAASFLDYLVPTAAEVPPIAVEHFESPAPDMPLGAKGAGEAGIVGPAAAIAQAVEDALSDLGVPEVDATPLTPALLRSLVRRAGRGGGEGAG
jgi:carbon-monoxide dehydrogenase large subunit